MNWIGSRTSSMGTSPPSHRQVVLGTAVCRRAGPATAEIIAISASRQFDEHPPDRIGTQTRPVQDISEAPRGV